jgi:hypothetical protein
MTKAIDEYRLKENAIRLANDHRKHCEEPCEISLYDLYLLLRLLGIEVTPEERSLFL